MGKDDPQLFGALRSACSSCAHRVSETEILHKQVCVINVSGALLPGREAQVVLEASGMSSSSSAA